MSTWQQMAQSIIENHEKVSYSDNPAIAQRVLKAINKAINHVWSKSDWTFKIQEVSQFVYSLDGGNTLPANFLSFHHTSGVIHLQDDLVTPRKELKYMPIRRMLQLLNSPGRQRGNPESYSIGGPLDGSGNQRSLFIYPIPLTDVTLKLVYQATAPRATRTTDAAGAPLIDPNTLVAVVPAEGEYAWTDEIPCIPAHWHESVIEEIAILFRLMDKSADITGQQQIVVTALEAMMRDEPHGREDAVQMTPAYAFRMNVRYI